MGAGKKPLSEQVVVVTGASSGLGRAIARGAGEAGAKVVVTARNGEALDDAVREIEAFGSEAIAVPADHAVQDEVGQVVEQALDRFGRIDTYVANAMVTVMSEVVDLQPDELRRVFDVNFFGMVYGYWAALPHLQESRRHVPARQLGARVPRHPAPGGVLRVEGGAAGRSSSRRASS